MPTLPENPPVKGPEERDKSAYASPRLTRFGPVQGLTLGSGGTMGDGQLGMTRGGTMGMSMGMGMGMGMN
ncbi:hypothetical protein [Pseudohalioglobus lutimaris]|uniref:Lasso RiPP family leader peptide-containing protein n=1 Tax=Pseudohalioglobus lutimaris TaxID=1737061 RepID=A0A2N5X1N9_9GAMM|nr:hypothetical protein [Pseudohalioglobus lutimaris]PLW68401.1 hypothetical protein C0039_12755 [Pseudohalioglobus lutimaris]